MIYKPDPHQVEATQHLYDNPRALLFLGMSLSKTVVTLTYIYDMIYREAAISKVLVVAPDKVARITWPDELLKWDHLEGARFSTVSGTPPQRLKALATDAEIYITGIDTLAWLIEQYVYKNKSGKYVGALPFDCVVLDELSLFKSRDSKRFKSLRRAIKPVPYRIGLTGTPSPNGLVDLWAQVALIDDGDRLGQTFGAFQDKYFKVRGNGQIVYEYIPRPGAPETIAAKIKDIALSMQTRDKIILPPLITVDETIDLEPYDLEVYNELEREYVIDVLDGEVTVKTAADLTNKLLQLSSGAVYEDRDDPTSPKVWHELNTAKLDRLGELLEKYPDENFILVYQYAHEVERVRARFPFARQLKKIQDVRDWNAGAVRLLILHPASAGHGLNLQWGGRRMVWYTCTWNLEHYLQTVARLLRRGAEREIYIHRLIVNGTRDRAVIKRVEAKDQSQNFILTEIKNLRRKYEKN